MALSPLPEHFNFARYLMAKNAANAAKAAYIDDRGPMTYGELDDAARRFAAGLSAIGVRPEERVLLVMLDTRDLPVAFLGCLFAGVVAVPVNTLLPAADYTYMIDHSRARVAIVSEALWPTVQRARAGSIIKPLVVIAGRTGALPDGALDFAEVMAHAPCAPDACAATGPDEIAFWLYSSGSTGRPKGAVHTHANLHWTAELYGKGVLGLAADDIVFSAAKLFFAYGLGNALTFPLSVGATTVLMAERPTPAAVFARLTQHRPTIFFGVPTLYVALLASPDLPARSAVALRLCVSAGEALPKEIGERFRAHFGCDILDGIGSTEMLHIFISNRPDDVRYGSTGRSVPGYDVELRDESGRPVADGEIGDLFIRGPSAALLYWNNREKSATTFRGEWVKSGDKYVRDAQGYYTYAGRTDDMLRVSGQYVSPIEVESALMAHPAVLECAVIGKSDHDGLTKTKAFVVVRHDGAAGPALADELRHFVKDRLAPHKYPREIEFIADLPKTATGKIQRFVLRAREEGSPSPH